MNWWDRLLGRTEQVEAPRAAIPDVRGVPERLERSLKRLSKSTAERNSWLDVFNDFKEHFKGYPDKTRYDLISTFRKLAQTDDDVGGSLRDLLALAITDVSWEVHAENDTIVDTAEAELLDWHKRIFPTGLDGLASHQAREVYLTGASSLEWVPEDDATGIRYAAIVPTETIRIRTTEDGLLRYFQVPMDDYILWSTSDEIELDSRTYQYRAYELDSDSPYALPAIITALRMISRKYDILDNEDRVIRAAANIALVTAAVGDPDPASLGCKGVDDPNYQERLAEYYEAIASLIAAGSENGVYVHPAGIEVATTKLDQNLQGATDLTEKNQKWVWSGLGTQGYLRGDLSANYALAKVIHPQLLAFADSIQIVVKHALEYGMNLHLRLRGIPAEVSLVFAEPPNPFRTEDAAAEKTLADTDSVMLGLIGDAWIPRMSARLDIDEDEIRAGRDGRPKPPPVIAVDSESDGDEDAAADTEAELEES